MVPQEIQSINLPSIIKENQCLLSQDMSIRDHSQLEDFPYSGLSASPNTTMRHRQFNILPSEIHLPTSEQSLSPSLPHMKGTQQSPISNCFEQLPDEHQCLTNRTSGILVIHLISGSGLKTTQLLLRDLYCVLETDSIRKARSMIRTNTDYFDWDEVFEVEVKNNRFLSFLLYQWDSRTRHRLCFYGGVDINALITRLELSTNRLSISSTVGGESRQTKGMLASYPNQAFENVALQLEPKGVLYLELSFIPTRYMFLRRDLTQVYESSLFGISLDELVYREQTIGDLFMAEGSNYSASIIPFIIRKCVEEIDRRGVDVVGIYRLTGSVSMKIQLRELFIRTTEKMLQGLTKRNVKNIQLALSCLDLSADFVPDIHAVTATMKDFFRELPEPIFTNTLYPMVYEASHVAGLSDPQMGTKLILNILDCLPTSNQEVILFLLDHLKRVLNRSSVNKMTAHSIALSLAPGFLYPSPAAVKDMDPALLDTDKMVSVLECILNIWP